MTRVQLTRGVIPQICKQTNELELWTTAAAGQTITPRIDFPAQYAGRVYWQISDGTLKPATSGSEMSHTFAANGSHRMRLIGVPVDQITRIDANSDYLTGDIGKIRWPAYRNLVTLSLYSTGVTGDIASLAGMSDLVYLSLYSTGVTGDISNLAGMSKLVTLSLYSTGVTGDIASLAGMSDLANLYLSSTGVTGDIASLAGMSDLVYLHLYSTGVTGDISNLAGMSKLVTLSLYSTGVTGDIASLAGMSDLAYLYLYSTGVTGDIASLAGMSDLANLYLYSTSVTCGATFSASWVGMQKFQVQNCLMSQAAVGNIVESIWNARLGFTYATPALKVGGTNAAPAGNVAAPPGDGASNSDWDWDGAKYKPLTAGAMIWDLAKDVNSEGFKKWAITYNGGSI